MKILRKLWDITGDFIWTIIGSITVIITLSGDTQRTVLIMTIVGTILHYFYKMVSSKE
jgi:hypothetical protein